MNMNYWMRRQTGPITLFFTLQEQFWRLPGRIIKNHSGVIAFFRKEFIKTGILDKKLSDIIQDAFEIRTDCDYEDFYVVAKEDVEQQIKNAEYFISAIEKYLQTVFQNNHTE